jgi:hypothetical protein
VLGFYVYSKTIHIFPKGLGKFFKNLKLIDIRSCNLKAIHQSDLKHFPNLVYFYLYNNRIEVIEEGLFDFNPDLQIVGLNEPKIIHIDPNVFDNLIKLSYFWFEVVPCIKQRIDNSIQKVQEVIKVVKSKCVSPEFLSFDSRITNFMNETRALNSEDFMAKFENLENNLEISVVSKFRPLNYRFQNLKLAINSTKNGQVPNVPPTDPQNLNSSSDLKNVTKESAHQEALQSCPVVQVNDVQIPSSDIKSLVTDHGNKLDEIIKIQDNCMSNVKTALTAHGSTLENLKASHDQMSATLTNLKTDIDEKLETFEENLINSEGIRNGKRIEEMKKELDMVRYKISLAIDSKLKIVENRLMEKIDEKLNKILKGLNIEN